MIVVSVSADETTHFSNNPEYMAYLPFYFVVLTLQLQTSKADKVLNDYRVSPWSKINDQLQVV